LTVRIVGSPDEELALLTTRLRGELLELDVESVEPVVEETAPPHAKGLATLVGWLTVGLGTAERLRAVVTALRNWVSRTNRSVEITYGGDVLKLSNVTAEQQDRLIEDWLTRRS
jgi:hypothetical protein